MNQIANTKRQELFDNYYVEDVAFCNDTIVFALAARWVDSCDVRSKVVSIDYCKISDPSSSFCEILSSQLEGLFVASMGRHHCGETQTRDSVVVLSINGQYPSMGESAMLNHYLDTKVSSDMCGISNVRNIGSQVYAVGWGGFVAVAEREDLWHNISIDNCDGVIVDIAGFSPRDIYAVTDFGMLYHYDGAIWRPVAHPHPVLDKVPTASVDSLNSAGAICCAGDGAVYVWLPSGTLVRGRVGQTWDVICRVEAVLPFKDMVWFDDRLWFTDHTDLWFLQNKEPQSCCTQHRQIIYCCDGAIDVAGRRMVVGGQIGSVALYDTEKWSELAYI